MSGGWGTPSLSVPQQVGETMVWGKTPEVARDLLAAAETLGYDLGEVRTVTGGFIVPDAVFDLVQSQQTAAADDPV